MSCAGRILSGATEPWGPPDATGGPPKANNCPAAPEAARVPREELMVAALTLAPVTPIILHPGAAQELAAKVAAAGVSFSRAGVAPAKHGVAVREPKEREVRRRSGAVPQ